MLRVSATVRTRNIHEGLAINHSIRIALIGYSLGGLVCRHCAGVLLRKGFFGNAIHIPWFYASIASPHLGARRSPTTLFGRLWTSFAAAGGVIAGKSGTDLVLADDDLILLDLSRGVYLEALSLFAHRILVANIAGDNTVGYRSAAMVPCNPYKDKEGVGAPRQELLPGRPHVTCEWVGAMDPRLPDEYAEERKVHRRGDPLPAKFLRPIIEKTAFANDDKQAELLQILTNLNTLVYHRVDVDLKSVFAHGAVIVRRPTFHSWAKDVVERLCDIIVEIAHKSSPSPSFPPPQISSSSWRT